MALGTKTGGKPFEQGNKLAKGGRRNPPGGRPSNAQLAAKTAMIEIWEKELAKKERKVAARYAEQALKDNRETAVMPAFLLFWVSFPFGFQLVWCRFSLGMSCPFLIDCIYLGVSLVRAWCLLLSGLMAATTAILLELHPFFMLSDPGFV